MEENTGFAPLETDIAYISKLDDEPNDVGGMTAEELKAEFDKAGGVIKDYLNGSLLPELEADGAAGKLGAQLSGTTMTVQQALNVLQQALVQGGNMPIGGSTGDILRKKSGTLYDAEWYPAFATVTFEADDWTLGDEDERDTLTIPKAQHGRTGPAFGFTVRQLVGGVLKATTWGALETECSYNQEDETVVLTGTAFDGAVSFYG